jgi:hypothetical protein
MEETLQLFNREWQNNIKMNVKEKLCWDVDWIKLAPGRAQ